MSIDVKRKFSFFFISHIGKGKELKNRIFYEQWRGVWVGQVRFLLSKYVDECNLLVGVQEITFYPYLGVKPGDNFFHAFIVTL